MMPRSRRTPATTPPTTPPAMAPTGVSWTEVLVGGGGGGGGQMTVSRPPAHPADGLLIVALPVGLLLC